MIVSYENFCLGRSVWEEFSLKKHSRHIATQSALTCLAQLLTDKRPKKVVELGGGIGTISHLMWRHDCQPALVATLEDSPICLPALTALAIWTGPWKIVQSPTELTGYQADLLIVDGGTLTPPELNVIRNSTIIFCEGNRDKERAIITRWCIENRLNLTFANEFVERLDRPDTSEKSCWIGTATSPLL